MGISDKVNDLKQGPKEDKVVVATGAAVSVVVVLLIAWAIYFFHNIASGKQSTNLSAGAQDEFNFSNVKDAQQQLQQQQAQAPQDELIDVRNSAQAGNSNMQQQTVPQATQGSGTDQFGNSGN